MADCGASGSALDVAARALVGGNANNHANKALVNVLHQQAVARPPQLPMATPQTLPRLSQSTQAPSLTTTHPSPLLQQPPQQHPASHHAASPHASLMHPGIQQHPHLMGAGPSMAHAMHHQQLLMQQQQHQIMHSMMLAQQQQRQLLQQQQQQQSKELPIAGHEGKVQPVGMEELAAAWKDATAVEEEQPVVGHEGQVQAASIHELADAWRDATRDNSTAAEALAEAWAAAEEEYQQHYYNNEEEALVQEQISPTEYEFRNKVEVNQTQRDWMAEGMKHFQEGNIKEAILAFESELQLANADNAQAWRMLGQCHAENDMDHEAILCFENAVDRDPYSVDARLSLGVSYLNELHHDKALEHLKAWITHNPQFAGLKLPPDIYGTGEAQGAFDDVQQLLLRALNHANDSAVASEIYEALGVVYNVSRDYDAAVDAFRKAIAIQPSYHLYNKLGATLANSSRSAEALPNYNKALSIKPKYARAWLNMAISHSNLEDYNEAARCYLQTLSLNPGAVHCWSYLRIALSCAERLELMPLVVQRDLGEFKKHFDFVTYD